MKSNGNGTAIKGRTYNLALMLGLPEPEKIPGTVEISRLEHAARTWEENMPLEAGQTYSELAVIYAAMNRPAQVKRVLEKAEASYQKAGSHAVAERVGISRDIYLSKVN